MFQKFSVGENVYGIEGLGVGSIKIFRRKFFVSVPKYFVEKALCVLEIFAYRNIFCVRGDYHDFRKKICCLTEPKNFVGQIYCLTKFLVSKKFMDRSGMGTEGESITIFHQKIFVP